MEIRELIGAFIALGGSVFLFLGALGIVRMPDIYNRMQTGTKSTTLGTILTLLGIGIYRIEWLPQMLILIAFILATNPVSSHTLARAAHFTGIPLTRKTVADKLAEEEHRPAPLEEEEVV